MSHEPERILGYRDSPTPFTPVRPEDEFLHPIGPDADARLTETQYFCFNIPSAGINGEIYVWLHPVSGVVSGGLWIWQGNKPWHIAADYHNYQLFMPMPAQIGDYALPNGLTIKVLEPLKSFLVTFADAARDTSLRLQLTAIMPPAGRGNGGHLTQAMRTRGELMLRGQHHRIDGFATRDRSWGEPRSEAVQGGPPWSWTTGVFDENFAFHVTAFDSRELHPEWEGRYDSAGANLLWGYVWKDSRLVGLKRVTQRCLTEEDGVTPRRIELALVDTEGREFSIQGTSVARCPWMAWLNQQTFFCLTRWECEGRVGWGDIQHVVSNDHAVRFLQKN